MTRTGELLSGAVRIERYMAWELLGSGKVRGLWRLADGQDPDALVELHLDARGRVIGVREWLEGDSRPLERQFKLDGAGRLIESQRRGPHPAIALCNSYVYDGRGMLKERRETDVESKAVRFRTVSQVNAAGFIVENALHDGSGALKERATYEVDAAGRCRKEQRFRGDGQLIGYFVFDYDAAGHEISRVWHSPAGEQRATTTIRYDDVDRPAEVTLSVPGKGSRTMVVTYDQRGKKVGTELRAGTGEKTAEIRPASTGATWRSSFVAPPPPSGDGRAPRLDGGPAGKPELSQTDVGVAYWLFEQQRYGEAFSRFEALGAAHPEDVYLLSATAACALKLGRWELALSWYDRALARDPQHGPSRLGRDLASRALRGE